MDEPGLAARLGIEGRTRFLVQHQLLTNGHSYRVLDPEKRHLFTIQGNAAQDYQASALASWVGGSPSGYEERYVARSFDMTYSLLDAQGSVLATFAKRGGANSSIFTLTDYTGQPRVTVTLERGITGGITATAVFPDGRPMMQTHGNLMRHDFMIRGPAGNDLAKVHEAWASVHDTYSLDIVGNIDPLYPLAFAVLIDYEKVK